MACACFAAWPGSHGSPSFAGPWLLSGGICRRHRYAALLLLLLAYDMSHQVRIHVSSFLPSLLLIALYQIRMPIGRTGAWQAFAGWVQNLARSFR